MLLLGVLLTAACFAAVSVESATAASIARPADAWLARATPSTATIRWTSVSGAASYELRRGGKRVATVRAPRTSYIARRLSPATFHQYQVVAKRGGARSIASDVIPAVTTAATGCTHYVASNGSDSASGSSAAPWRSIQRLVDAWQPGWVGCLTGSFAEDVSIRRGGSGRAKVTLRSTPGTRASLRGRVWIANGANNVVIAELNLDGRAISDNERRTLPSPTINGNGAMLLRNDISNARTRVCAVLGSIHGYGSTSATTLAYNRIHDCGQAGSNTNHGIYVESGRNVRIVHNVIARNASRGIQLYPDAQRSLIVGNLIEGNGSGVIFSGAEGYSSSGNRVVRNVIANSTSRNNIEHYWEAPSAPGTRNVAVRNCLGGARQGNLALPVSGYAARANLGGVLRYRNAAGGDWRPAAGSGCRRLLRSSMLPLAPLR
ncbi:MAG: NosD domain-containing protein [Gaiellales bacterium]